MDYTKLPLGQSLNQIAHKRAAQALQNTGRSLPASVVSVVSSGIVTVRFELDSGVFTLPQVTVPLAGPEYIRFPIQPGCKGFVVAADARLHQMSGLGTGQADLTQPGNLTALVFVPFGSTEWFSLQPGSEPYLVLYGENGVLIQDRPVADMPSDPANFIRYNAAGATIQMGGMVFNIDRATGSLFATIGQSELSVTSTQLQMKRTGSTYGVFVNDSIAGISAPNAFIVVDSAFGVRVNTSGGASFTWNGHTVATL